MNLKEKKIYDFIIEYMETHHYPPSVRSICDGLNIRSTSTVAVYIKNLCKKGYLLGSECGHARTIRIPGYQYYNAAKYNTVEKESLEQIRASLDEIRQMTSEYLLTRDVLLQVNIQNKLKSIEDTLINGGHYYEEKEFENRR